MIVKTNCETNGSSAALVVTPGAGGEVLILRRRGGRISNLRIYWDSIINANIYKGPKCLPKYCVPRNFVDTFEGQVYPVSECRGCCPPARAAAGRAAASWRQRGHVALVRASVSGQRRLAIAGIRWTMEYRASDPNWHWEACSKMVTHTDTPCNFCKIFSLRKYKPSLLLF